MLLVFYRGQAQDGAGRYENPEERDTGFLLCLLWCCGVVVTAIAAALGAKSY